MYHESNLLKVVKGIAAAEEKKCVTDTVALGKQNILTRYFKARSVSLLSKRGSLSLIR